MAEASGHQNASQLPGSDDLERIEAEALELLGQRKRRKRVRYSCTECHRRKHRCDRETPCAKCIERGVASACIPHDGNPQYAHDRIRQLEDVLSRLLNTGSNATHSSVHHTAHGLGVGIAHNNLTSSFAGWKGSASQPGAPRYANTAPSPSTPDTDGRQHGISILRRKSNPGIVTAASLPFRAQVGSETLEFSSSTQSYPPSAHFERLVNDGSVHKDEIRMLASALPAQDQTAILLDIFFRDINPLMFPFDEMWFREAVISAVDVIWGESDSVYGQEGPNHLSVISLLFAILTLTYLSQPPLLGSDADGAAQAARMSHQCRRANMLAASIHCHDLFIVLSHVLLARFLMLQRQAKDSWLVLGGAIREAQILNLHRLGPAPVHYIDQNREAEMRRIIWMHLYLEDRFSSLIVGQAPMIRESFCDTRPPSETLSNGADPSYFDLPNILRARYRLSSIVGKALDLFFSDDHEMVYEAVLNLDHELQAFKEVLPSPYGLDVEHTHSAFYRDRPGGDDGSSFRRVALHRFVLHIDICYVRISIHLPYLRRGSGDSAFQRSRQAALEAAIDDHRARQKLRQELDWPNNIARDSFVGGRFFYFHATSTLGICLLSEPDVARAKALIPLLDEFLEYAKAHQRQPGVDPNRCVRQEISIVSLIRGRVRRKFGLDEIGERLNIISKSCNFRTLMAHQVPISMPGTPLVEPHCSAFGSFPSQMFGSGATETRQQEVGEDMYDWWSWLVSSLSPSDPISTLVHAHAAAASTSASGSQTG